MKSTRVGALFLMRAGVLVAGVAAGLPAMHGCGDDGDGDAESDEGEDLCKATGAVCVSTLTYAADVAPLMTKYCTTCHATSVPPAARMGAPTDHNFETEAGVLAEAEHVDHYAGSGPSATNTLMPPPASKLPAPTTEERAKISSWLACQTK
jgi:uncharacterized membrane protein